MQIEDYDQGANGTLPPPAVLAMLTSPATLRARAEIRRQIAQQDRALGDTLAEHRNRDVAHRMEARAARG